MGRELMGLKTAINGGDSVSDFVGENDEALQVEEMERMMSKLQFIKGMSQPSYLHSALQLRLLLPFVV